MAPTNEPPPPYIVEPISTHTHSLILLHGLGSNGERFGKELLETGKTSGGLTLPQLLPGARFVFPTSRRRRSTAFGRSMLTQWFETVQVRGASRGKEVQLQGLSESAREILDLLRYEEEVRHIPPGNILLGGLSQGCAMSLSVLLCLDHSIGGFVGMSGYLPFREDIDEAVEDAFSGEDNPFAEDGNDEEPLEPAVRASVFERDLLDLPAVDFPALEKTAHSTPVFLGHGSADEQVRCPLGDAMAATMKRAGYKLQWKRYQGLGHWYGIPDEIDDIVEFIRLVVGWDVVSARISMP